jgi:beta-1,4-N-acetylglucosaminyltransferase
MNQSAVSTGIKQFRILLPSSAGGHLAELLQLRELLSSCDCLFVTEDLPLTRQILAGRACKFVRPKGSNRNWVFWLNFLINWLLAMPILLSFRPHAIVTAGSHTAIPFCYLGKLLRCKVIYILSFARIDSGEAAATAVYPIADLFFVQWEQVRRIYPKSVFVGPLF